MASDFDGKIQGLKELNNSINAMANRSKDMTRPFKNIGQLMIGSTRRNFQAGGRPVKWPVSRRVKKHGGKTLRKTSKLMNSVHYVTASDHLTIMTNERFARIHQFGGVIKAKNAKFLTIPLSEDAAGKRARDFSDTFFMKSKNGNLLLMQNTGEESVRALYLLRKSVRIPARTFLLFQDDDIKRSERIVANFVLGKS